MICAASPDLMVLLARNHRPRNSCLAMPPLDIARILTSRVPETPTRDPPTGYHQRVRKLLFPGQLTRTVTSQRVTTCPSPRLSPTSALDSDSNFLSSSSSSTIHDPFLLTSWILSCNLIEYKFILMKNNIEICAFWFDPVLAVLVTGYYTKQFSIK